MPPAETPDGRLLFSWGESGTDPGQFNIAHNIATDKDGWVYVADRENHRIQVFDPHGKFDANYLVAVDTVDAGFGETVLIVSGSSARMASGMKDCPVDAAIVGIVDTVQVKD